MIAAFLALIPLFLPGSQEDKRQPVPEATAQKEAEKVIRGLFKDEYARRAPADKLALAKKLLEQGLQTTDDPISRYVLLREAQDLGAQAGRLEVALKAIEEASKQYQVDAGALRSQALTTVGQTAKTPDEFKSLAELCLTLSRASIARHEIESAAKLAGSAATFAKKAKDMPLVARAETASRETADLKARYEGARKAREVLAANPEDAQAKSTMGWHHCAVLGDWEAGLALLAGGADEGLKAMASKDLGKPIDAADQASLGDQWWDLAEKKKAVERDVLRRRAVFWYQQAAKRLSGLSKVKVEKRLSEIRAEDLAREGWVDITDPSLFDLPGRKGEPLLIKTPNTSQQVNLKKMPVGDFVGFSMRLSFDKGSKGQVKVELDKRLRELYIQNGSFWSAGKPDPDGIHRQDFMVKVEMDYEYVLTGLIEGGEYVFTLDGQEYPRVKTAQTRLSALGFFVQFGEFTIDEIRLKRKE